MENQGVKCDVTECVYNANHNKCEKDVIEVTNMKTSANSIDIPHFCKSYTKKDMHNCSTCK